MRLGLDIGTNSIGWWLYETESAGTDSAIKGVIDGGVRIFSDGRDPKSGASLAVDRRAARAMRRRRDRYLRRRASLMKVLAGAGLMPADPAEARSLTLLDPYELRARGLDEPLPLAHLGRALFHLNQRRGFKSNRKTDRGDNESGKIKDATQRLDWAMHDACARTYGEFLHMRRARATDTRNVPSVRTRLSVAGRGGPDAKEEAGYDFYPERRHLEAEFHALWAAQAEHFPDVLTGGLRDLVFEKIFYQRPLKEPVVGLCLFSGHHGVPAREKRLPKAHPLVQRRTLYETVNQLRITADGRETRPLIREERDRVVHSLDNKAPTKSLSSMSMTLAALAKVLKLRDGERFTLETGVRDAIACDPVRASLSHPDRFGPRWSALAWGDQWEVIGRIRAVESDSDHEELVAWLIGAHQLDADHAAATANAPLPEGYGRLGLTATQAILEQLRADVLTYSEAVAACGWHHSNQRTGEYLDRLPYYGEVLERHVIPGTYDESDDEITRYGRITNPTVHIGLNQLRRLLNRIIDIHGKPDQIVVELARELKQSEQQKREAMKRIRDTTADAQRRSRQLEELRQPDTGHNRMLLRLWEDLGPAVGPRCCPYTGETISVTMLFDGSCDVDHILPYSRTLDDSFANRTLCLQQANRDKRNRTPWEAWGGTLLWDAVEANLKNLSENKRWRFAPDAMERFEGEREFLDRALVDTQYLARIARTYLDTLYTKGGHVWVVPGRMTEMLRRHWGLNSLLSDADCGAVKAKNRTDHRHHAIDAAVVAATDRSLLNRISRAAGQGEEAGQSAELVARETPPPWEGFRSDVKARLTTMIVSHRADHGRIDPQARKSGRDSTTGQLHNDTAYGIVDATTVVSRTPLLSLKPGDIVVTPKGKNIRDPQLQMALEVATRGKDGKAFEAALAEFAARPGPYRGLRRVRLIEALQQSARVEIGTGADGRPLKAYKGDSNHCYELWRLSDGKVTPQVVTTFESNTGVEKRPHPAAKRLLRIFKRDMVAVERDGQTLICYVQKLDVANGLFLAEHTEANADARHRDKDSGFRLLQLGAGSIVKARLRRVFVDEAGRLRDPGPKG
ncbi:type II CRISPR RNA-guided endonuclease Cas9 [Chachezhania antarctica]|uniref:type II CRISPR RNA-guided endonuclease Cas9 n=1 Tax=Chachezhania antarctica TaxID=2340860 RepID=UPI000EB4BE6F|nr:type II CRISPR RNA-guided endonuclease Cas9 [Chachezhania antarctica]|tara:strand:+ start:4809 stop:8048 length:3240 start_codon:yes stop_codon:yes gene_type:complete